MRCRLTWTGAVLAGALVAAGLVLAPASASYADPASPIDVRNNAGDPASSVAAGDVLSVSAPAGLVSGTGDATVHASSTWNPAQATVDTGSVVAPEGSTVEYTTDGTHWDSTVPGDPTTIRGVRAAGTLHSGGTSGGEQLVTGSGSGTLKVIQGFSGASGGDGWDAFGAGNYVLNIWHHNGDSYNLDCHLKLDASSCSDTVYSVSGMTTSGASSGAVVGTKVYSMVGNTASGGLGVLCTDISAIPFTSCGFTELYNEDDGDAMSLGSQALADGKLYAPTNQGGGQLLCFDAAHGTPCTGQPYAMSGLVSESVWGPVATTIAVGDTVFVAANQVWCFDATDGIQCAGTWPAGSYTGQLLGLIPMRDSSGTLTGVCLMYPSRDCYDLTGTGATFPAALSSLIDDDPLGGIPAWSQYTFGPTKQYWFNGGGLHDGWDNSTIACWDWTTGAACSGFHTDRVVGDQRYAMNIDDVNTNCVWTNGNNGQLASFNATTGTLGCSFGDPVSLFSYKTIAPRLSCGEAGRVRQWTDMTLTVPHDVTVTDLRVNVKNHDGTTVTGGSNLIPDGSGVVDLSGLNVSDTGTQPTFEVTIPGGVESDATDMSAAVRYLSDPAALCFNLTVRRDCPSLQPGISTDSTFPLADMSLSGSATQTLNNADTTTDLSATVTRANVSGCLGTVGGHVQYSYTGGTQGIAGQLVTLAHGQVAVGVATSDGNGAYSFANVNPGTYTAYYGARHQDVTVTAGSTPTADLSVPVPDPTVHSVTSATLKHTATTFAIDAAADPATSIDLSTVRLYDPSGPSWGTTLTVDGEGTWTVDSGNLHFTPTATFTGTTTAVTYRVADAFGDTGSATAQVTVSHTPPTAAPTTATGVRGEVLTITPNGRSPEVSLDHTSLRLMDPTNGQPVTTLTVHGVGTYVTNPSDGTVQFTPEADFVGADTVLYTVADVLHRTATSTLTVTLTGFTLTAGTVTVNPGATAHLTVGGVPAGSTLHVPGSLAGAASVSVDANSVAVVPSGGYSGRISVPVTVTHGVTSVEIDGVVLVRPGAVPAGGSYGLDGQGDTVLSWPRSMVPTHSPAFQPAMPLVQYQVTVDGVLRCTTTRTGCALATVLGPHNTVRVYVVGGDGITSNGTALTYRPGRYARIGTVYFGSDSATLPGSEQAKLRRIVAALRTLGFTSVQVVGNTDNRGDNRWNMTLSQKRADATKKYLAGLTRGVAYRILFRGAADPVRDNGSPGGRAANRRVEIWVA